MPDIQSLHTADTLIRLEHVCKSYTLPSGERLAAVDDVSLQVKRGEVLGLIGTSGAGKSTLLRLINLLERADSGRVEVDGRDLTALGKRELRAARQGIGMIFQNFNLLQNATVADNVAFPLRLRGQRSALQVDERVRECLDIVGLDEKARSYPAQLSGGQKQRVAIARALAPRPAVMLCDEPTSALDADTTGSLLDTLHGINVRLGVTIVIVTHELGVARALCKRVAVMEHGALVEQFALADPAHRHQTSLGRELARLAGQDGERAPRQPPRVAYA